METRVSFPDLALIAGALSDPIRLQILDLLTAGADDTCVAPPHPLYPQAMCPQDLQSKIGTITSSKLSYHLNELQRAGLVQEQRQGKRIYYMVKLTTLAKLLEILRSRYMQDAGEK